jgi:HPt (histidine-containing phosphotransfer) domain-containing protein
VIPVAATPDPASEVLKHLRQLEARGSPGLAAHVLDVFLRDAATRMSSLRDAIDRHDGHAVHRAAHTLQGSAAMVGASSMALQCAQLVEVARAEDFDRCEAIVADLIASCQAIQRAVTDQ